MSFENNNLILSPKDRIDSVNAKEFEQEVLTALDQHPGASLTFDFNELKYISSAGLRVLLAAAKRLKNKPRVINASPEVYEILDVTGFTSLLNVDRKLRSIDVTGAEVIGQGATATVYRTDPDTIVKVYEIPDALEMIRNEQLRAKQAFIKGIPTAISYDAVRVGDRYGSMFELLNARTFIDLLVSEPERMDELVEKHVDVIRKVHSIEAEPGELPDCREIFLNYLEELRSEIPEDLYGRLAAMFRAMPEDRHLIHGDIHMKNVMLSDGEPILIDMETLSTGNPVFDLGDLFVAYQAFNEDDEMNSYRFIGIRKETADELMGKTLDAYLGPLDEKTRADKIRRVQAVGYVRFLQLVVLMHFGGEELIGIRKEHTIEHLYELLGEIDGFAV